MSDQVVTTTNEVQGAEVQILSSRPEKKISRPLKIFFAKKQLACLASQVLLVAFFFLIGMSSSMSHLRNNHSSINILKLFIF